MIRTCCLSRLCCSFSLLGVSPVPVTGWQLRAPSATRGTTTWCSALSALLFLASAALASTKGRRAFYEWEVWIAHLLDQRLARVLGCSLWALNPYETGDPYPVQLVQLFQEFNPFPGLVAFLAEATTATGHWLCGGSPGRELFLLKFVYKNIRGALIFEVMSNSGVIALD